MLAYCKAIIAIESRLNICLRYEKTIKSTSSLTRYVNTYRILVVLLFCPLSKSKQASKCNNTSNTLDVPLYNIKKNLGPANID